MNIYNEVKSLMAKEGLDFTEVVERANKIYNENETLQNYSNKLRRGSITFKDVSKLVEATGYRIVFQKKEAPKE